LVMMTAPYTLSWLLALLLLLAAAAYLELDRHSMK